MGKLKIRSCTHCHYGEVFIDHDQYGWYESCLQCGYSRDLPDLIEPAAGGFKVEEKLGYRSRTGGRLIITGEHRQTGNE